MLTGHPAFERWLACREKTCCSHNIVYPTGDEIVGLAGTLELEPDALVMPLPSETAPPTAYRLRAEGPAYRLALVRTRFADEAPTCGFLLRMHDGAARCGLGVNRPRACKTFPLRYADEQLWIDARGCTCGPWTPADLDESATLLEMQAGATAFARYRELVARWNASLATQAACEHADFFKYLVRAYVSERR